MSGAPEDKQKPKREPRPPGEPKAAKVKPWSYEDSARKWESRHDRGAGNYLVDKPELEMDAAPFLATLRQLGYQTQDKRFHDLLRFVLVSGLVDLATGKWSRFGTMLAHPLTRDLCAMIEEAIASGVSEREALAEAVAAYAIEAATFDAAVKRVKRVLAAYRKTMGQKQA